MASDCRRKPSLGSLLLFTGHVGLLVGCAAPIHSGSARGQSPQPAPLVRPNALPPSVIQAETMQGLGAPVGQPIGRTRILDSEVVPAAPTVNNPTGEVLRMSKPAGASEVLPIAASAAAAPLTQPVVRLVAYVGDTPIYDSEVRESLNQRVGEILNVPELDRPKREAEIYREELKRIIERELIITDMTVKLKKVRPDLLEQLEADAQKDADKRLMTFRKTRKIPSDDEFKKLLQSQGLTLEGMRRQMARGFMMNEYIRNLIGPRTQRISLTEIRDYYDDNPNEFATADSVVWNDLFLRWDKFASPAEARKFAAQVISRARQGEDFVAMVKQYDHGDSSFREGLGLGNKRGEIRPAEVETLVFSLKPGEVGPPVEMDGGLHIVRVVKRDYAGRKPFDVNTQKEIRNKLSGKIAEVEYRRIIQDLQTRTPIVFYPNEK
ncbi:peptidylprolyl isomerase [Tuwongella immobilis]|uniref:PpiC domain-containing protein n=1 Tax=Tuwongella immobilis TaxID=692036 RepID=A0A6C2YJ27_9BACT|nr:peptidylprolyl isomerase [Tuwongella immobilis]VIP01416.1 -type peptidyl-prolyl cis-trans isomerase : Peptidylprolyl isomerase OS=Singulisphaera acidiphila (strain ATCC BAA-1392 / DSM 18658 / VKM B-2454 / MOB10) GN=Sinac_6433 PE=4 SV=1: Rotamase_2 [Tuwongella immobilis]VTR98340.1 -type peptidyl-prolyl cis-trans isomerase : Peptidylprolyl isomerase OS=Singulisphaera acidiphila (strain ATCC BAA-1392 / DSM 18658 / VKM B-2454 / MOB10) GN=Sinac_6433 PE=4 SV=1: Rotamase_2 [Tuwongella immobilis]